MVAELRPEAPTLSAARGSRVGAGSEPVRITSRLAGWEEQGGVGVRRYGTRKRSIPRPRVSQP